MASTKEATDQSGQAATAAIPEARFQLAGFRPHRVHDPILVFLAVQVQMQGHRWAKVEDLGIQKL